jgi:hypothetical protein
MGPEKVGKTFWMIEMAYRALRSGSNVLYFNAGDLTRDDFLKRMYSRICHRTYFPGVVQVPVGTSGFLEDGIPAEFSEIEHEGVLGTSDLVPHESVLNSRYKRKGPKLRCLEYSNGELNVQSILNMCSYFRNEINWTADVIIIDYADILGVEPSARSYEYRHQINARWMALRALSQLTNTFVLTATQVKRTAYGGKLMDRGDTSEDKRMLAHVNGAIGLNQTPEEKEYGSYRLNWPIVREKDISPNRFLRTAGCLGYSNPLMMYELATRKRKEIEHEQEQENQ